MDKEQVNREGLILRLKVLRQAACLGAINSTGTCTCTPINHKFNTTSTGCIELTEVIELLEAMTDNEFEYIKWTHTIENVL